ncbi:hypothetical protein P3T23_007751 [Paraburkholderia sp. GAS448]
MLGDKSNQALVAVYGRRLDLFVGVPKFTAQICQRTQVRRVFALKLVKIERNDGIERFPWRLADDGTLEHLHQLPERCDVGFGNQLPLRPEMPKEAALRQAGSNHDVGDACCAETLVINTLEAVATMRFLVSAVSILDFLMLLTLVSEKRLAIFRASTRRPIRMPGVVVVSIRRHRFRFS